MSFKSFFNFYKYPQYGWAQEIINLLKKNSIEANNFIDAPCGNGEITYWLSKHFKESKFLGVDLDIRSIEKAKGLIRTPNSEFQNDNILKISSSNDNTTFLFINSLFLLPETNKVLDHISENCSYCVGLFPYVDRKNFKEFVRKRPSYQHTYLPSKSELIEKMSSHNLNLIDSKDISFVHHHKFIKIPYLYSFFLKVLNVFNFPFRSKDSAYWVGLFKVE